MNKSELNVCLQARKMLHNAKVMMDDNIEMTPEMMGQVVHAYEFCKIMSSDTFWEELRSHDINYDVSEMDNTEHHKHSYKHKCNKNDIDKEMDRIIEHGTTEHMQSLAKVISDHFEVMKVSNPTTYNGMLEKMKKIM